MSTATATRDVDDITELAEVCGAPAQLHGVDGPITLGRCFLGHGHEGPHRAPFDRMMWGGGGDAT